MSLLEIKHVSKIYGELKALDDVSLTVEKGEWIAIMGPSGSGKSTMMNIIGCMDKPTSGQVLLDGMDISRESGKKLTEIRRDKIGLIFQQFHMVSYLTAVENVMVSQYYHSMPDESEALEALDRVGLKQRARHLQRPVQVAAAAVRLYFRRINRAFLPRGPKHLRILAEGDHAGLPFAGFRQRFFLYDSGAQNVFDHAERMSSKALFRFGFVFLIGNDDHRFKTGKDLIHALFRLSRIKDAVEAAGIYRPKHGREHAHALFGIDADRGRFCHAVCQEK